MTKDTQGNETIVNSPDDHGNPKNPAAPGDHPVSPGTSAKKFNPANHPFLPDTQEQLLIEYFKEVRGELTERVKMHVNLILQKIATCGAALGFLLDRTPKNLNPNNSNSSTLIFGYLIVPIIALGYDILIARNINVLHRLGSFIREEIEPRIDYGRDTLWENQYGQEEVKLKVNDSISTEEQVNSTEEDSSIRTKSTFFSFCIHESILLKHFMNKVKSDSIVMPMNHGLPEIIFLTSFTFIAELFTVDIILKYTNLGLNPKYLIFIPLLFLFHIIVILIMLNQIISLKKPNQTIY